MRGALSAVTLYADAFVSGFDMDPHEHTRIHADTRLLVVYIYVNDLIDIMRYIA